MINIIHGDCIEKMASLADNSVDLVLTDPPYLVDYKTNRRLDNSHKFCSAIKNDSNPEIIPAFLNEAYRVLKNNRAMYVFCSPMKIDFFKVEIEKLFKIKNIIIWVKDNWTAGDLSGAYGSRYECIIMANKGRCKLNGKRISDVWVYDKVSGKELIHQNQKPVSLLSQAIRQHTKEGDVVLDPFMGSASTGVACYNLKRDFIGIEIDDFYYNLAEKRLDAEQMQLRIL